MVLYQPYVSCKVEGPPVIESSGQRILPAIHAMMFLAVSTQSWLVYKVNQDDYPRVEDLMEGMVWCSCSSEYNVSGRRKQKISRTLQGIEKNILEIKVNLARYKCASHKFRTPHRGLSKTNVKRGY